MEYYSPTKKPCKSIGIDTLNLSTATEIQGIEKARDSFLLIIEFLEVPRCGLKSVLALLRPKAGEIMFRDHVQGNKRFHGNDFYETHR
jgi:hypothetical protein